LILSFDQGEKRIENNLHLFHSFSASILFHVFETHHFLLTYSDFVGDQYVCFDFELFSIQYH